MTVQEPSAARNEENQEPSDSEDDSEDDEEDEDDEEEKRIEEDVDTCDAEAEIASENIPTMLQQLSSRTRAFVGDWSSLPVSAHYAKVMLDKNDAKMYTRTQGQLNVDHEKYDMIVTSETIYAEHALPDLISVFQKALKKPDGIW